MRIERIIEEKINSALDGKSPSFYHKDGKLHAKFTVEENQWNELVNIIYDNDMQEENPVSFSTGEHASTTIYTKTETFFFVNEKEYEEDEKIRDEHFIVFML